MIPSSCVGRASLEQQRVAGVAHSDGFGRRRQRELVVRAAVTEDLSTVPAVVLERKHPVSVERALVPFVGSCGNRPSVWRWRTPFHTACSGWRLCPSATPDPPAPKATCTLRACEVRVWKKIHTYLKSLVSFLDVLYLHFGPNGTKRSQTVNQCVCLSQEPAPLLKHLSAAPGRSLLSPDM